MARKKFHGSGDHKTFFFEHGFKGGFGRENFLRVTMVVEIFDGVVWKKFFKRADGEIGVSFFDSGEHFFNHLRFDQVVAIDKSNKITGSDFKTGVTSGRETLVFLVDDF